MKKMKKSSKFAMKPNLNNNLVWISVNKCKTLIYL